MVSRLFGWLYLAATIIIFAVWARSLAKKSNFEFQTFTMVDARHISDIENFKKGNLIMWLSFFIIMVVASLARITAWGPVFMREPGLLLLIIVIRLVVRRACPYNIIKDAL